MSEVTIIIPSYGHAKYLPTLFNSIINQTFEGRMNVIISDDWSKDNSWEVCNKWLEDKSSERCRITLLNPPKNLGALGNCQYLVDFVKLHYPNTDYIQLIESDDYFYPAALADKVAYLEAHPGYAAVHTDVTTIDENGVMKPRFWKGIKKKGMPVGFVRNELEKGNFIMTCTFMARANKYLEFFDFNKVQELGLYFGDYFFFLSMAKNNAIGYIDKDTSYYRVLSDSMSHSAENRHKMVTSTQEMQRLAREGII